MSCDLFLVNGNVFARKMWVGLFVDSEVEVLEREDGEGEGKEAGSGQ